MLELERLTNKVEAMAQRASEQLEQRQKQLDDLLQKLHDNRTNWSEIRRTLNLAQAMTDAKLFRAARPFDEDEPLDVTVAPVDPPHYAILNGVDGSQILPDRHAPYLYYLINVGIITYFHGRELAPTTETFPELVYPENEDADEGEFVDDGGVVNIRRDLKEISSLAEVCWQQRQETDVRVAVLDQRLLYWPTVRGQDEGLRVLIGWQDAMTKVRDSGALLCGYIDRPAKSSVVTMLRVLDIEDPGFNTDTLNYRKRRALPDTALFGRLLRPGQRSKIFIDISDHNEQFYQRDRLNEVCFFYFNAGGGSIARIDIPRSVAEDRIAVAQLHGLLWSQCQFNGGYPYLMTRADEVAVVRRQDKESLDIMIANMMERYGIRRDFTGKQQGKNLTRARHR